MIDVHCHLNFHRFEKDVAEVIKRAFEKGVTKIINVGTKIDSSQHAVRLAEAYDDLYAIVGVHPHHADKPLENSKSEIRNSKDNTEISWLEDLEKLAKHKKVLGIGEIGMDFYSYKSNGIVDPSAQKNIFIKQIELAIKLNLPLQIHNRHAGKEIIEILKHYNNDLLPTPGMFHCMSGDISLLKSALQMGFFVGFDGNITYPGIAPGETAELKDLVSYTPLDRIVVESDSPYLTPAPHRGTRNEPQYVILTARFIAKIKNTSFESVVAQTTKNVYTIFTKLNKF